jgi:hypothetical protein
LGVTSDSEQLVILRNESHASSGALWGCNAVPLQISVAAPTANKVAVFVVLNAPQGAAEQTSSSGLASFGYLKT